MATSNLVTKSLGSVEFGSGSGLPNHNAPKGSYYINIDTNRIYVNLTGLSNGWSSVSKNQNAEIYIQNNTLTTTTATNSWRGIEVIGTMSQFTTGFTYSSQLKSFLDVSDGGFENTITTGVQGFADNGWTVVNGAQTNRWFVGTTGASGSGFGAYVSQNNGATNTYNVNAASDVYFYRDVVIEPYVSNVTLSFSARVGGEANFDRLWVYIVPTTTTFTAGTPITGNQQYALLTGYATQTVSLSITFSSTTQSLRIGFGWENDGSLGNGVGAAVDNITLTSVPFLSMTYNGELSKFRSVLSGSFYSPVATAIATASLQISKNFPDEVLPISSYNLAASTVREGFVIQNIFTMSSGDVVAPVLRNQLSNVSVTFNDLRFRVWEID